MADSDPHAGLWNAGYEYAMNHVALMVNTNRKVSGEQILEALRSHYQTKIVPLTIVSRQRGRRRKTDA